MEGLSTLSSRAAKNPEDAPKIAKRLTEGIPMSGTVRFSAPTKYKPMFDAFSEGKSTPAALRLAKGLNINGVIRECQNAKNTTEVSLNLSRVKSSITKGCEELSKAKKDASKNESVSILTEDQDIDQLVGGIMVGGAAVGLVSAALNIAVIAGSIYSIYMVVYCINNDIPLSIFKTDSTTAIVGSGIAGLFLPMFWGLMMAHKLKKKGLYPPSKKNESVDLENDSANDSVISMMEGFATGECCDACQGEKDHDSGLIEAYRKVVEDLVHRVPKDNSPMK